MRLPDAEHAVVENSKVELYLLSTTHAHGRHKQRVFAAAGYTAQRLADALIRLAREADNAEKMQSPYGHKFAVRGQIPSRSGSLAITTIWMLRDGKPPPYFVTAYPSKR